MPCIPRGNKLDTGTDTLLCVARRGGGEGGEGGLVGRGEAGGKGGWAVSLTLQQGDQLPGCNFPQLGMGRKQCMRVLPLSTSPLPPQCCLSQTTHYTCGRLKTPDHPSTLLAVRLQCWTETARQINSEDYDMIAEVEEGEGT